MLHQIKAQHLNTDLDDYQQCYIFRHKIVEFKDFSRPLSDFPVVFKADLIFKYFSRKFSFQACANPESSKATKLGTVI